MSTVNYLLATWSGKRRNPSKDYLKAQIGQLSKLKHNLDQITIIKPLGSDDPDYYNIGRVNTTGRPVVLIERPTNDRAYGQFLFAYDNEPGFDYYFLVEDDYLPACDNFDTLLIQALEFKKADYLCGSFGPVPGGSVAVPRHNVGVIQGDALRRIAELNVRFLPSGEGDGQEQEMFGDACRKAGVKIADYSDLFSVPYYDRYLRYFSPMRNLATPFAPYQLVKKKAFGYHGEEGDEKSHFLSTMEFHEHGEVVKVTDQGEWKGTFLLTQSETSVEVSRFDIAADYVDVVKERILYICRNRSVTFL